MGPINGQNHNEVNYFSLEEYVNRIKLSDSVLFHLEDTNKSFDNYMSKLAKYDVSQVIHFWIQMLEEELQYSNEIEQHFISPADALKHGVYFDNFHMNHDRIKQLHNFVTNLECDPNNMPPVEDYRSAGQEVRVSKMNTDESETIFWRGANGEDVQRFMDDFVKIYKTKSLSAVASNPFLKSALLCMLFIRIHPFTDGNGRTGRMIYNIKFTDFINNIYKTDLKLCPLNISHNIFLYRFGYVDALDNIYFDLEHDSNDEINKWFDFILTRADETIFYNEGRFDDINAMLINPNEYGISGIPIETLSRIRKKI